MGNILVVEDNKMFATVLTRRIEAKTEHKVVLVTSMAEAVALLEQAHDFFISLLDLHLPDAPQGEIVDAVLAHDIPTIVFTGDFSDHVRDSIWAKPVVDYVLKEGAYNVEYLVSVVERIARNPGIKVLVVDDSNLPRTHVRELLEIHRYQVLEAADGREALEVLKQHPDIKLAVVDYNMPHMDGFELTKRIRATFHKEELAVIGMSTYGNHTLSAKFIKNGANDFLNKPFYKEEFYCRISQNVEMLEHVERLNNSLVRDYLTNLYNRRYLFEAGGKLLSHCRRNQLECAIALVDIDHFKNINDKFGHHAGDIVLRRIAEVLGHRFRDADIVSRYGGEEFCIMVTDVTAEGCQRLFEELRTRIAATTILADDNKLQVTVSIGICHARQGTVDTMIRLADEMLYQAKDGGRNRTCLTLC